VDGAPSPANFVYSEIILTIQSRPAYGHGSGVYVSGKDRLNSARGLVLRADWRASAMRGSFGADRLVDPCGIETVIAPEPATWLVLGIGALALRRRRPAGASSHTNPQA